MRATMSINGLLMMNPGLFDVVKFPVQISRQAIIDGIILECAELELVYTEPYTMQKALDVWSASRSEVWEKLYKSTVLIYNPIENYNRVETWTDSAKGDSNTQTVNKVQGFNSSDFEDSGKNTGESGYNNLNVHSGTVQGNIGVTTTQQMLEQERKIVDFSVIDFIVSDFKKRFCLLLY